MNPDTLLIHRDFIRGITRGLLFDDTAREDVVQETMIAALDHGPRDSGATKAWLKQVALNFARRELRSAGRRRHWEKAAAQTEGVPSAAEIVEREDTRRSVVRHVLALPSSFRDVVVLRYFEDLTPKQIGQRLDIPAGTASSRLNRGLAMLREELDASSSGDRSKWMASIAPLIGLRLSQSDALRIAAVTSQGTSKLSIAVMTAALLVASVLIGVWQPWQDVATGNRGANGQIIEIKANDHMASSPETTTVVAEQEVASKSESNTRTAIETPHTTATGTVRDLAGKPIAYLPVRYSFKPSDGGKSILSDAYTDANGDYETRELGAGKLWMTLLSEEGFGPSQEFTQEIDASIRHDFRVHGRLSYAGTVTTEVPDDLEMILTEHIEEGEISYSRYGVRRVKIDSSGGFHFTALHPGKYIIKIRSLHHIAEEKTQLITRTTLGTSIQLHRGLSLVGKVELGYEGDPGRSRVRIRRRGTKLRALSGAELEDYDWWVSTDKDGSFRFRNLPAGDLVVSVTNWLKTTGGDKRISQTFPIEVTEDGQNVVLRLTPKTGLSIRVIPPIGIDSARGVIEVFDADGMSFWKREFKSRRLGDKLVMRSPVVIPSYSLLSRRPSQMSVDNVTRDTTYKVRVSALGCATVERAVTVSEGEELQVDLQRAPGQFLSADGGSAEYWQVLVRRAQSSEPWRRLLWTDSRVHITNHAIPGTRREFLAPGRYEFRFEADAYRSQTKAVVTLGDDGSEFVLRFPLESGITGSGRLVNSDGLSRSQTRYYVFWSLDGSWQELPMKSGTTGDEGKFGLTGLEPGLIKVSLAADGGEPAAEFNSPKSAYDLVLRLYENGGAQARVSPR